MTPQKTVLKVTGVYRDNARSYYTVKYNMEEYRIPLLPFQIEQNIKPEELDCIIKEDGDSIRITQDFAIIINSLYKVGETYTVKIKQEDIRYYRVEEPNGLIFLMTAPKTIKLRLGQQVRAKVESIELNRVMMSWVEKTEDNLLLPFHDKETLRTALNFDEETIANLQELFRLKSFSHVQTLYNEKNSMWLFEIIVRLDEILLGNGEKEVNPSLYIDLFQKLCIYVLEESNILRQMSSEDRKTWISKISAIAQHADDYKEAYRIMDSNESREYIEHQLKNLQESENLYQPERKFRIIMCLFNLNEDLMNEMMERIFAIISGGNQEHWKAEPFRKAFVDMLELFISEYRERAVQRTGTDIIYKMITAIAIQQLLSTGEDDIDRRLNQATYYRLLAYVNNTSSEAILNEAFHRLFGQYNEDLEYTWSDVNDPVSLYFRYSYKKKSPKPLSTFDIQRQVYYGNDLEFIVDGKNLVLQPALGGTATIDLNGLVDWRGFELRANNTVKSKAKEKVKDLVHYWGAITEALLKKPHITHPQIKQTPSVGDTVWVKVINDDQACQSLECEIVDDIVEGKGWLDLNQIVKYIRPNQEGNARFFWDEAGNPLLFEVVVIEDADDDGYMLFSMLPVIKAYFTHKYSVGDIVKCNVRAKSPYDYYVCVSEDGASCQVTSPDHILQKDEVVNAVLTDFNQYGQLCCDFESQNSETFSVGYAYKNLLRALGTPLAENIEPDEEQILEDPISTVSMKEVIGILDRLSSLKEKKTEAYSLLSVAQLLAKMLNDTQTDAYYEKRKSLIFALEEYEQNGYVDENKLAHLIDTMGEDLITTDYLVNETITKFKILDALKHKDHVDTLFEIRKQTANPKIRAAADLGIAILLTDRFEISNVSRQLHDRINRELEITVHTSTMRDFGIETQEMEFKSSIIYPANNHMQPYPQRQRAVIMQTICGFLNSDRGGTLYIGVNKDGGAYGVEHDLKYLKTDEDGFGRLIHSMINEDMGQIANQCCTDCEWIEESGYKIYVMKIKPSPELIALGEEYWIRQDTEKRPLKPENVEQFRKMHQDAYKRYYAE